MQGSGMGRYAVAAVGACLAMALQMHSARAADPAKGDEALQWLNKIAPASRSLNYEGTFVYRRDDQLVGMRIIHVAGAQGEREQLISLNGYVREVIRDKNGVTCILPHRTLVVNRSGPGTDLSTKAFEHAGELSRYYRFKMERRDRTAGRPSRKIVVKPLDDFRYGYRIWVDEETGLLLGSDLVKETGEALEQIMFTSINVMQEATPAMLEAVTLKNIPRSTEESSPGVPAQAADTPWEVERLPGGFQLMERLQHASTKTRPSMGHLVYSDGLATVSVFVEKRRENDSPFEGVSRMGAVNAFGKVVNDHQVTVVGEVPLAAVQLIGESVTSR